MGYFLCTAALIPDGLGALCAYERAALALLRVFMGNEPFGAPPEGPANDFTPSYFPTFDPPGFFLIAEIFPLGIELIAQTFLFALVHILSYFLI